MNKNKIKKLYPVTYNGKVYEYEDCDECFIDYYEDEDDLADNGGVYLSGTVQIFPDGSFQDLDDDEDL